MLEYASIGGGDAELMALCKLGMSWEIEDDGAHPSGAGLNELRYFGSGSLIGYLLSHAPSVRHAIGIIVDFGGLEDSRLAFQSESDSDGVAISCRARCGIDKPEKHVISRLICVALKLSDLADGGIMRVETTLATPPDSQVIGVLSMLDVRFSLAKDRVVVEQALLDRPVAGADPHLFRVLSGIARRKLDEKLKSADPIAPLRDVVSDAILQNKVTLAAVAGRLGISTRSVEESLSEAGQCFPEFVSSCRRELARRLLSSSDMPIGEIAHKLGFAMPSAFSRAARSWFGVSPREFRRSVVVDV